jgi:hypothetical protein
MLADMFAADNSQFKRERFISACQPGANVRARSANGSAIYRALFDGGKNGSGVQADVPR